MQRRVIRQLLMRNSSIGNTCFSRTNVYRNHERIFTNMKKACLFLLGIVCAMCVYGQNAATAVLYIDGSSLMAVHTLTCKIDKVSLGTLRKGMSKIELPTGLSKITLLLETASYERPTLDFASGNLKTKKVPAQKQSFDISVVAEANKDYVIKVNPVTNTCTLLDEDKDARQIAKIQKKYGESAASKVYLAHVAPERLKASVVATAAAADKPQRILSDVDKNIPVSKKKLENTFVLIIANEDYQFVDKVDYALYDGQTFKEYCVKTLGVPERQVWLYENASYGIINQGVSKMVQAMDFFDEPNAIIYYCGHGIPDEKTGDAYIIPTDGTGKDMAGCYSLNKLYTTLAETKATKITYFLDACFTGASKKGSMLVAARGVAITPKAEPLKGKTIVFSATSSDETAMAYQEKQHGLFTYFLLKKLQETEGDVSYEELHNYINKNVKKESFLTNEKPQTPMVATSPELQEVWRKMTMK